MPGTVPLRSSGISAWRGATAVPSLGPSVIHLWQIALEESGSGIGRLENVLTPEELSHAGRFHFPHDRRRFVIRRAALRQLLAAYLQADPLAIRLQPGAHGKPFLVRPSGAADLRFSCSHSGEVALIAIACGRELGVDLELHHDGVEVEELARNYFSAREIQALAGLPPACKRQGFFDCWTRKEAFVKAVGLGLSYPLHRFSVSLTPDTPAALESVADHPEALEQWSLIALDGFPNYSAALVFEGGPMAVTGFKWCSDWLG